jgi:hypothetical protein
MVSADRSRILIGNLHARAIRRQSRGQFPGYPRGEILTLCRSTEKQEASITSSPLFIRVAESMVTFSPSARRVFQGLLNSNLL